MQTESKQGKRIDMLDVSKGNDFDLNWLDLGLVHSEGVLPLMRGGCLDGVGVLGLLCLISRWPNLFLVPWYMRFDENAFSVTKQKKHGNGNGYWHKGVFPN
ncbi:hypothetical protein ACMFMG_004109 [Clarireedia jacksonii]